MRKQVLNIEQMRHLQELGVDTSKASTVWNWETNLLKTVSVPVFTLQDVIELLPDDIHIILNMLN